VAVTPVPAEAVPLDEETRELFAGAANALQDRVRIVDHSTGHRLSAIWVNQLASNSMIRSNPEAFARYFRSWANDDLGGRVQDVATHALVLVGGRDPSITIEVARRGFSGRFRNVQFQILAESGHYPMDECPLQLGAQISRFLTN
jgi:esterase